MEEKSPTGAEGQNREGRSESGIGESRSEAADAEVPDMSGTSGGVSRRRALQVIAAGAAGAAALPALGCAPGDEAGGAGEAGEAVGAEGPGSGPATNPLATGTPTDPDLLSPVVPWDLVLTDDEMRTVGALCDVIIPADDRSPSATAVAAHEFVNEWVSAPYDGNRDDLVLVRGGLVWLDVEAGERFGADFADLTLEQKHAICDDICYQPNAKPEHRAAARFFDKVRDLTSTAFWTTEEGMADLGFVGNRPTASFPEPPREVLEQLGLV